MNCYYHPNKEATKVCYVCSKSICTECCDTLVDKTICNRCKLKVATKIREKFVEQQSEERKSAYLLPFAGLFLGVSFLFVGFAISSEAGSFNIFHIISLIMIGIGVMMFLAIYYTRKKERYIKEEKLTPKKKMGWVLLAFLILLWLVLPAAGLLVDIGGVAIIAVIVLSFILLIAGLRMLYSKK